MFVVAGGTGRLGRLVVAILLRRKAPVRVLTRDPDSDSARDLAAQGVDVVYADVRAPATLREAVRAARTVVSAVQGEVGGGAVTPATVDLQGNVHLVDAAAEAGAGLVLVSVAGAAADSPLEHCRAKAGAERHLRDTLPAWTIVRAPAFAETWIDLLERSAAPSGRPVVLGRGDNPVTFVCVRDVAQVVADAALDGAYRGSLLQVAGPDALTVTELAELVQARAGRAAPPRHVPPAALRIATWTAGLARPELGRRLRAALAMESADLVAQSSARVAGTPLAVCLADHAVARQ
ncbi:MAG: SDR family oxidoreductase [Kineosporiaceae bacterium]